MRFFTILSVLMLMANYANSQSFQFKVDTLSDNVHKGEFENYISNFAVNMSDEGKTLRWTQTTIFKGSQWSNSQVCDNNLCYTDKILTRTIDIQPGDSSLLKILFRPNGQDTCGYYTISVQEDGTTEVDETAHYFFNGENCSALSKVTRLDNVETVQIYPNPSVDYVQLSSKEAVKNISIYDSKGVVVAQIFDYNNGLIPVKELPTGTYYMMLSFYNGKTGVSKLFKN